MIVIGLALFAFIAGDAWKVMQPHQTHDVGEVNGDALSAQEYQNLVEEYTEVVKLMRGVNALNDEQTNQVRDEVWRSYVNNKLIEKEAKALGLTVSTAEIQDILKARVIHTIYQEDTIASHTKSSSQALHPIEAAYFHQSHLKRHQDYGHQVVSVMLSCNGIILNYAVILYVSFVTAGILLQR